MAPLRVAGLIEFHVFETEPLMLLTYCIAAGVRIEGYQFELILGLHGYVAIDCRDRRVLNISIMHKFVDRYAK
jgi:hypothetical protein